jgi:hypothetical protein
MGKLDDVIAAIALTTPVLVGVGCIGFSLWVVGGAETIRGKYTLMADIFFGLVFAVFGVLFILLAIAGYLELL